MHPTAGQDPEQLLSLARQGHRDALGLLLQLYDGYLALLARLQIGRRLRGKVDAADLVQETFLEAHRHFARFQGPTEAELVAWLRQILAARGGPLASAVPAAAGGGTGAWSASWPASWTSRRGPWTGRCGRRRARPASRPPAASRRCSWPTPWAGCPTTTARRSCCGTWR